MPITPTLGQNVLFFQTGQAEPEAAIVVKVLVPTEGEDPATAPVNLCAFDPSTGAARGLQRVVLGDEFTPHWHYRWPNTLQQGVAVEVGITPVSEAQ